MKIAFSLNFSCMFLNLDNFLPVWIWIVLIYQIWETSRNKFKMVICHQNCSDLLWEQFLVKECFLTCSRMLLISNKLEQLYTYSNWKKNLGSRNMHEKLVRKAFYYQKLFRPFTDWINCSSDLKNFAASNFKSFSRSLEQFFLDH